jgi:Rieske Fe-S protein
MVALGVGCGQATDETGTAGAGTGGAGTGGAGTGGTETGPGTGGSGTGGATTTSSSNLASSSSGTGTTSSSSGSSSSSGHTSTSSSSTSSSSTSSTSSTSTSSSSTSTTSSSSGSTCTSVPAGTKLGKPTDYAANGLHILAGQSVLIGRDANGLYALTAICTHQGCNMDGNPMGTVSANGITCNCHGSRFSTTGAVVGGPATQSLRAFALALGCDGFLYVDTTKVVPSTQRLKA